jgi:hypothetical protein
VGIDRLEEEIRSLPAKLKNELFKRLKVVPAEKKCALEKLIGIDGGPKDKGSHTYEEDLYGGQKPL